MLWLHELREGARFITGRRLWLIVVLLAVLCAIFAPRARNSDWGVIEVVPVQAH